MSDNPFGKPPPAGPVDANPFGRLLKGTAARGAPGGASEDAGSTAGALWDGLLHGLGNVVHGAARIGARMLPEGEGGASPQSIEAVDRGALDRQKSFEQQPGVRAHPTATAIGEVGGEMAATAPLGVGRGAASLWERLLQGATTGGASGAVGAAANAPAGKDFAPAVARGAAAGAAIGGGFGAAGSAARPSSMVAPRVPAAAMVNAPETRSWREAARMLTSQDVRLSPGQARNVGYKERSLQEWPILRNLVKGAVGRSVDDFNRAVVSQALSPIGAIVPRSVKAGHDLMDFGTAQLNQAYDRVLPNLSLNQQGVAHWFQTDPELQKLVGEMASDDVKRLTSIVQNRVLDRFAKGNGVIDGNVFKEMERDLSGRASTFRGGNSDELGRAISYVVSGLRDELATQNPRFAPDLQKINHAFSMWARVRAAAGRDADGRARFSPRDLLQTIKGEDASAGGNSFARGREPMQAFAEAGNEIIDPSLTSRVPETSKSAARYVGDVVGGAVGATPYAAAIGAQAVPGLGLGIAGLGPGAGFEAGKRSQRRPTPPAGSYYANPQ